MPQTQYNDPLKVGFAGQIYDDGPIDLVSLVNDDPQAKQISTITIDSASNDTQYAVTINGLEASYTSASSGATTSSIAEGLRESLFEEPGLAPIRFTVSGAVITATSRDPGFEFTIAEDDASLSVATSQSAADAAAVEFGRMVVRLANQDGVKRGRKVESGDFTGSLFTLTNTADNSVEYSFDISLDGVDYNVAFTSDASATSNEISTGLKAAVDALSLGITATVDGSDDLVLQGDDGVEFQVVNLAAGGAGALSVDSQTAANFPGEFLLSVRSDAVPGFLLERDGIGSGYPKNYTMACAREGRFLVEVEGSVTVGNPVYVRTSADGSLDEIGGFADASGTGLVRIDNLFNLSWHDSLSGDFAVLQID